MFAKSSLLFSLSSVALAALTACGGGGGGSSDTAAAPVVAAPVVGSPIVTTVAAATYTVGSEEVAAFDLLNAERSRCGFGLLTQNTALDTAAKAHASYMILNNQQSHSETSGLAGFTGVLPADRVLAAGYSSINTTGYGQPSESFTTVPNTNTLLGSGVIATRGLLAAPYHLQGMFRGYKDAGTSVVLASSLVTGATYIRPVFNFGTPSASSPQLPGASEVLTYPCQGSTGINYQLAANESPEPVPGRNLFASPLGHPILINVRYGNTLGITSATLIKVSTGAPIVLRAPYTKITDTVNSSQYYANEGFILPDGPLEPSTQYQATVNGTNNGVSFSRTFSFTTGTGG